MHENYLKEISKKYLVKGMFPPPAAGILPSRGSNRCRRGSSCRMRENTNIKLSKIWKMINHDFFFASHSLTMSAGCSLKAAGLWCGVLPEEAAVGRADRLVWDELVVFGKLSPSPRSSSSRGGDALVIPPWVSCSRGLDSGRDSSPSRPAFWLFCLSSAVAPLSSWAEEKAEVATVTGTANTQ